MADAAAQDREAARAEFKRLVAAEGLTPDQAMARVRGMSAPGLASASTAAKRVHGAPSQVEAAVRGGAQGATMRISDEIVGAGKAVGRKLGDVAQGLEGQPGLAERYRQERDLDRQANAAARAAHPKTYTGSEIGTGIAATLAAPGAGAGKLATMGSVGAAGAASGLGGSEADLTKGEFAEAGKDTGFGTGVGLAAGAAGLGLAKVVGAAGKKLAALGKGRLFKAAVGQNKKAFTQINGKDLYEKSGDYLDALGVGWGDSTESIAGKLTARTKELGGELDVIVSQLDEAAPSGVSPFSVAQRIEKEVAAPLKKLAANQNEYKQAQGVIDNILDLGDKVSFKDAAAQRRAFQDAINYDARQGLTASADAKRKIAEIWNDVIDDAAEPALKKLGQEGDAYRELRHEMGLVLELSKHVNDRVAGNATNRLLSPSDHALGIGSGLMTGNPLIGLTAAAANHIARSFGNAAAGRTAVGIAKLAAGSKRGLEAFAPKAFRATGSAMQANAEQSGRRTPLRVDDEHASPIASARRER